MAPARRCSGYDGEWLRTISLTGLQKLAKLHEIDADLNDVPEMIEALTAEEEFSGDEDEEELRPQQSVVERSEAFDPQSSESDEQSDDNKDDDLIREETATTNERSPPAPKINATATEVASTARGAKAGQLKALDAAARKRELDQQEARRGKIRRLCDAEPAMPKCAVCHDCLHFDVPAYIYIPCGHRVVCEACAEHASFSHQASCIVCRREALFFTKTYSA